MSGVLTRGKHALGNMHWETCIGKHTLGNMHWETHVGKHALGNMHWETCIGKHALGNTRQETHIGKHTLGNMLPDASMSPLDTCQRHALVPSILPLLDLNTMKPNVDMSHQKPLDSLLHAAMVSADDNEYNVRPHPNQGGEQIMEAYLQGMSEAECIWRFRYASLLCV